MWNLEISETLACPMACSYLRWRFWALDTALFLHSLQLYETTRNTMCCCTAFKVSYRQTYKRGAPPTQGCPGGREAASAPAMGRWGTKRKQQSGGRGDGSQGRKVLPCVRFRHPPRDGLCGAEGLQSPTLLLSARCWGWCTEQHRRSRKECKWKGFMNLMKYWRSAFLGQLSMKKLGRICPVSEKIDGVEDPS